MITNLILDETSSCISNASMTEYYVVHKSNTFFHKWESFLQSAIVNTLNHRLIKLYYDN